MEKKYTTEEIIFLLRESARKFRLTPEEKKKLLERILKTIRTATKSEPK